MFSSSSGEGGRREEVRELKTEGGFVKAEETSSGGSRNGGINLQEMV